ncbi:hypothetical protein BDP55DRAFT_722037 [Colletotrichum godetiae]|uniref:Uncharacterized protein n=1 Tax=Colletotrichum godetiae TaxID=1209918 RepID=A0AAJ0A659_9PEZI|nr:uncharacterized protein BDP55DRAFT_722037 [Colletotrichum godetiae]KAK1656618.1 hypothetical protein BDP55DRAFT_722037 [Colletotrichum godetiae]
MALVDPFANGRRIRYKNVHTNPREANTNSYWDLENQAMYPVAQGFLTAREDYPDAYSNLKFDRTVSEITHDGEQETKVVTGEDKRPGARDSEVKKAEDDVEKKSLLVMEAFSLSQLYCQTTSGTTFRLWMINSTTKCLQPLFGGNTRGDSSAYIDISLPFGQFEWHRLGSLVKNEEIRPLEDFGALVYLVAPPDWMFKLAQMQKRLEAQEQQRLMEENISALDSQAREEEWQQQNHDPVVEAESGSIAATGFSYTEHLQEADNDLGDSQYNTMEIGDSHDAPMVEPQPEASSSRAAPSNRDRAKHRVSRREKRVTVEKRTFGGYKFVWEGKTVTTDKNEWKQEGDILRLRQPWGGYSIWANKP